MSGIYLHIPFCKQACHYCDFHFSTSLNSKSDLIDCLIKELELSKAYLKDQLVNTIYFGGGTPSLLEVSELNSILSKINSLFSVSAKAEITLEANPDDLTKQKINELKSVGINRLSIGIQSFRNEDLKFMNRAHNEAMAVDSITSALDAGISNLNIDLIYGIPNLSTKEWIKNLERFFSFDLPHLSAYCLTFEEKTAFGHWLKTGKISAENEEVVLSQFQMLMEMANKHGYEHYEISNFAKDKKYSVHNTSYWTGESYLGIGPSAHSYNGTQRRWNVSNNALYIKSILNNEENFEEETLTDNDHFNEYMLTSLRTMWGIDMDLVDYKFGEEAKTELLRNLDPFLKDGHLIQQKENIILSEKGKFVADKIASELFRT